MPENQIKINEEEMAKKNEQTDQNSNGFPLNGGFPEWITKKICSGCNNAIKFSDYISVGFFVNGEFNGKLFVKYECSHCNNKAEIKFGDETFTIERLCTLVMQHSNILKNSDKINWKSKHIK